MAPNYPNPEGRFDELFAAPGEPRPRWSKLYAAIRKASGGTIDEMRAAVKVRDDAGRDVVIEASGGLTLEVARQVGETGVDYVAVGELTHSAKVLDLGLDLEAVLG